MRVLRHITVFVGSTVLTANAFAYMDNYHELAFITGVGLGVGINLICNAKNFLN